jgi:hypothetical protein
MKMNKLSGIIYFLFSLLLFSCRENISVEHTQVEVKEIEHSVISELPDKLHFISDTTIVVQNSNNSFISFDPNGYILNSFNFTKDLTALINEYNLKKFGDSTIKINLSESSNNYWKDYPEIIVQNVDYRKNYNYLNCVINNAVHYKGVDNIKQIVIIFKGSGLNSKIIDSSFVQDNYSLFNGNAGVFPGYSYIQKNDSVFYAHAIYFDSNINREILLVKYSKDKHDYVFNKSFHFPYPVWLITNEPDKEFNNPCLIPVCLKEINNEILFSNGDALYNILSEEKLFSLKSFYKDDSIRALLSFDVLKINNKEYLVFVESVLPNVKVFPEAEKYLNILSSNKKRILYRKYLGRKVSWVEVRNNTAYILTEGKEHIYLEKFKVNF